MGTVIRWKKILETIPVNRIASSVQILLADSMDLCLLGARTTLDAYPDCLIVATAGDFTMLVKRTRQHQPDVIVFGSTLDPDQDLWAQITRLRQVAPLARLLLMSHRISGLLIRDLLGHGLVGVLYKQDELRRYLYPAVRAVSHHRPYLSPTASTDYLVAIQASSTNKELDPEARQVLQLLANGEHAGQISTRLGINKRRVYWVREKLRRRFGAKTNEHLIQRATAEGFISPRD